MWEGGKFGKIAVSSLFGNYVVSSSINPDSVNAERESVRELILPFLFRCEERSKFLPVVRGQQFDGAYNSVNAQFL